MKETLTNRAAPTVISESLGLTEAELKMFLEIEAVIRHHPQVTRRFGVVLDHSHFPISDQEVIHETSDPSSRVSIRQPVAVNNLPTGAYPTEWQLSSNGPVVSSWCCNDGGVGRAATNFGNNGFSEFDRGSGD